MKPWEQSRFPKIICFKSEDPENNHRVPKHSGTLKGSKVILNYLPYSNLCFDLMCMPVSTVDSELILDNKTIANNESIWSLFQSFTSQKPTHWVVSYSPILHFGVIQEAALVRD
jgi:hypothetical protein